MSRGVLTVSLFILVTLGCDGQPVTAPTDGQSPPQSDQLLLTNEWRGVLRGLGDPFVEELLSGVGDEARLPGGLAALRKGAPGLTILCASAAAAAERTAMTDGMCGKDDHADKEVSVAVLNLVLQGAMTPFEMPLRNPELADSSSSQINH